MAGRLSQLPLPWIPDGAAEVTRGVGLESFPDGRGAVWVHGLMTFCWDSGDEAGRRLAAVQLAEVKAATQQQIAGAFGIGVVTLWRWLDGYRRDGLAGLAAGHRQRSRPAGLRLPAHHLQDPRRAGSPRESWEALIPGRIQGHGGTAEVSGRAA